MKITSYLVFNGQAQEAASFYANIFGGKIENLHRYETMPPMEGMPDLTEEDKQRIMHCCIYFPGGTMSIADTLPIDPRNFGNGGHILTISCESLIQAEDIYAKLCEGAEKINCPMSEVFYAKRYGEVTDRFGVLWAVMFEE